MRIGYFLSCEEYAPEQLVEQAVAAEKAGFEGPDLRAPSGWAGHGGPAQDLREPCAGPRPHRPP